MSPTRGADLRSAIRAASVLVLTTAVTLGAGATAQAQRSSAGSPGHAEQDGGQGGHLPPARENVQLVQPDEARARGGAGLLHPQGRRPGSPQPSGLDRDRVGEHPVAGLPPERPEEQPRAASTSSHLR
jgi:hypothetical protein